MTDDLVRAAKRAKASAGASERAKKAFKKPRTADAGERLTRKVKADMSEMKRAKKAKRAFKKR
jgi:hypothetical protein